MVQPFERTALVKHSSVAGEKSPSDRAPRAEGGTAASTSSDTELQDELRVCPSLRSTLGSALNLNPETSNLSHPMLSRIMKLKKDRGSGGLGVRVSGFGIEDC